MSLISMHGYLSLFLVHHGQPARLFLIGDGVVEAQGWRVGARRVLECKGAVVPDCIQQRKRLLKLVFGFARKTYDQIGGNRDIALGRVDPRNAFEILVAGVEPLHSVEHAIGAALDRKMHVVAECGGGVDGFHNVAREIARVGSGEADARNAIHFADRSQ